MVFNNMTAALNLVSNTNQPKEGNYLQKADIDASFINLKPIKTC